MPTTTNTSDCMVRPTRELAATYRAGSASYADLAAAVGCSKPLIGQIMNGQATGIERAQAIADFYGKPLSVLFRHKNGDPIGVA